MQTNIANYIKEQLASTVDQNLHLDPELIQVRDMSIQDWLDAMYDEAAKDKFVWHADAPAYLTQYLQYCEYLQCNRFLQTYRTRDEAIMFLMQRGMSLGYARAAIDQQYNYAQTKDDDVNKLWVHDESTDQFVHTTVSLTDMVMVYNTWKEMLSTEGDRICVDGEPIYDLDGNLIHD